MKKISLLSLIISIAFVTTGCMQSQGEETCTKNSGKWIAEYNECEYIPQNVCEQAGGVFQECASACRHQKETPSPLPCTLQCVLVCEFKKNSPLDGPDFQNISYDIEGESITLTNGHSEKLAAPDSSIKIITNIFSSSPADINNDGKEDVILILTQERGGSGTFYYVAGAIRTDTGYQGTNAIFIGDRIAPQTTNIFKEIIAVNYADRYPWEPFSATPSIGKTKYVFLQNNTLQEKPFSQLSQKDARTLVEEKWGNCEEDLCTKLTVNILDGKDNVWYLEAIYEGIQDDSVTAKKYIIPVYPIDETWKLGNILRQEFKCHEGRGQKNFSETFCK